jgi:hypothetical protein
MNDLEKHIRKNRDRFDAYEPSDGHMERFRAKINPARITFYSRIPYGLKVAVILLLVAITSVLVYEQAQRYYISRTKPLEQILPGEFLEAQVYYTSQIKQKHSEINRLNLSEPDTKNLMMKELEEMDRLFYSLMKDLKTNPSDERILSAMIEHYQVKLEIMSQIIRQLEKTNQLKSTYKSHDETEI